MALPTSGPNFDFSMFPKRYWGEALGGVGGDIADALRWRREQERKEEADRQKAKFENDQNANSEKRLTNLDLHQRARQLQEDARSQRGDSTDIITQLGKGMKAQAQARAAASQYEDPEVPGSVRGASLKHYLLGKGGPNDLQDYDKAVAAMPSAGPPPPPPEPTSQGEILSRFLGRQPKPESLEPPAFGQDPQEPAPDMARAAAGLASLGGQASLLQTAGGAAAQDKTAEQAYGQQLHQNDANQAAQKQDLADRERWGLKFASGPETIIDPREAKMVAQQQAQEDAHQAEDMAARATTPEERHQWLMIADQRRAKATGQERAGLTNVESREDSQAAKAKENALYNIPADIKAQIEMEKARHQGMSKTTISPAEAARGARQDIASLDAQVQAWQKDNGYDQMFSDFRDLQRARQQIQSGNVIEETGVRYTIGKKIAGPGVFTDNEQKTILGRVGGEFSRWEQLVKTFEDGHLTPEQERIFMGSIDSRLKRIVETEAKSQSALYKKAFATAGSGVEDMPLNVANRHNRMFAPFGVEEMPLEGAGAKMGLEAGRVAARPPRPNRPPGPHPAPGTAPPAPAATAGKGPPPALVEQAKARAAKGDTKAQGWLAGWGL